MKKLYLMLVLAIATSYVSCENADTPIEFAQLPAVSQEFINTHFAGMPIAVIIKDYDGLSYDYDVRLQNLYELEFEREGDWKKVDCQLDAVPEAIIPTAIADYVKTKFPISHIVKIERDSREYEVELSSKVDLVFDLNGNFKKID